MNFKKRVNGSWTDTPHYIHKTDTDILTTLPDVVYVNDTTATVGLKGRMVQSLTPTPDNPIMPQGTGERTGNLFDEVYSDISGTIRYRPIFVGDGTFTLSTTTPFDKNVANVFLLSGNVSSGASTIGNGAWKNHNVTAQSVDGYVTIAYRHYSNTTSPVDCQTMLNTGSTPLPYEIFGYKIPISSANTTTPVYLGEVETTRRIKKLVLTGNESYTKNDADSTHYLYYGGRGALLPNSIEKTPLLCNELPVTSGAPQSQVGISSNNNFNVVYLNFGADVMNAQTSGNIVKGLKEYLAAQYAAGTPVTVWYALAEPTTGIVNEPLRKIGDYADEVSGIIIPTIAGANTLSIGTALQPSEVTVNYKGWHPVQSAHERENGAWT